MAETINYKLKKPEKNSYISIETINENMDVIDMNLKTIADNTEEISKRRKIVLTAAGWSESYPYTQEIPVDGVSEKSNVKVVGLYVADGLTEDQVKAMNKAASCMMSSIGGVKNGSLTFKAWKKPETDFVVITEGG